MIRFANKEDVSNIKELWNIAFPEEPDFNEYFFENIFDFKNTIVMIKDNKVVSMAQMMPYELKNIGKVTYIYGAATNPQYRKQGLMSQLLKKSFEIDVKNNVKASILIPANKPLYDFYGNLGYETCFYANKYTHKSTGKIAVIEECSEIKKLSQIYTGDITRSGEYWNIQLNMYKALGGKILCYNNAYAVVSDKVEELMYLNTSDKEILLNSICEFLKVDTIEVTEIGGNTPVGMIKKHCKFKCGNMYMGLMFN